MKNKFVFLVFMTTFYAHIAEAEMLRCEVNLQNRITGSLEATQIINWGHSQEVNNYRIRLDSEGHGAWYVLSISDLTTKATLFEERNSFNQYEDFAQWSISLINKNHHIFINCR